MSTNHTRNYGLSQWEPGDPVLHTDFNRDNQIIDEAMATFGNCLVATIFYKGTGETSRSWTFSSEPVLFIIQGGGVTMMVVRGETTALSLHSQGTTTLSVKWETRSEFDHDVTWTVQSGGGAAEACNKENTKYTIVYFLNVREL